jgi:hypothetical protein
MEPDFKDLSDLINNFVSSLDYRSDLFMVYNDAVIKKIMEWQLTTWRNWVSHISEPDAGADWFFLYEMTNQAFTKIGKRSIKAREYAFAATFVPDYCQFIEKHKNESVKTNTKTWEYTFYSYNLFFNLLTEFIASAQINDIEFLWEQFPDEWKITANNLSSQKVFAKLALEQFLRWALGRTHAQKQEDDSAFHYLVEGFFPELDSRTWEIILLFVFSPYNSEARVKSVIERYWTIGHISVEALTFAYTVKPGENEEEIIAQKHREMEEKIKAGSQKAYELAFLLFPNIFSRELLTKYKNESINLKYPKASIEDYKREDLLNVLNGLEDCLNNP